MTYARRLRSVVVTAGATLALFAPMAPAVADGPAEVPTPVITGAPVVGSSLTAQSGSWPSGSDRSYQWLSDDIPIPDATAQTFTPTSLQADTTLRVEVSSLIDDVVHSRLSDPTLRVATAPTPSITGTYAVGSTLTARTNAWSADTVFSYRWLADGKPISGATGSTLRLAKAQGSKRIAVAVTGSKPGYPTVSRQSATSAKVFTVASTPKVSGTMAVGRTLKASKGSWMSGAKVSYRWYADDVAIKGATKSTYKIASAVAGRRITVRTTGTKSGYATVVKTSAAKPRVQRIGKPKLGGSTVATRQATASPGSWVSGTTFTYRWYLNGKPISGATSSSIYVKPSWKGKRLSVKVTGRQSGYSTFSVTTKKSKKITLPGRADPVSAWNCPSWAPIKGNADSGIYHLPRQRYYKATKPEDCFSTQAAARKAGYRKAKV